MYEYIFIIINYYEFLFNFILFIKYLFLMILTTITKKIKNVLVITIKKIFAYELFFFFW